MIGMRFLLALLLAIGALAIASPAHAGADIEIFTTADYEIVLPSPWAPYTQAGYRVVVFKLDDFDRIAEELSAGLPADPARAKAEARARFAANGDALRRRARRVSVGLERAFSLKLTHVPAIVFNAGEAVVYGETDVARAIAAFERAKETGRE
ncbi:TIGR03757 family integrating conjugative element protein [Hyphococcus luteus]|uniref:TIGR03757 family integrating conjugative element protein n=1 Tax=Hyphococcus luteus TaxID=2058213 RepID=A0A2S7K038_9PROT|nr:TIGR03757 family integrating conjugative element protein [Marinicaulis flavus]PQA85870.1 TIGR03757 family integrating conjugative element protein [Marinicaulis flavus]